MNEERENTLSYIGNHLKLTFISNESVKEWTEEELRELEERSRLMEEQEKEWELKTPFDNLIGKTVLKIFMNSTYEYIQFLTNEGLFTYYAEGDCCSTSWIEHLNGLKALMGNEITKCLNRDMPEPVCNDDKDYDDSYLQYYGWSLITSKGYFDIEMRNESNGYYGGSIEPLFGQGYYAEDFMIKEGKIYQDWNKEEINLEEIKEDF